MSVVLRRSCKKVKNSVLCTANCTAYNPVSSLTKVIRCSYSDYKSDNDSELGNSSIFIENGFQVQELPVVVRKLKNLDMDSKPAADPKSTSKDTLKYHLIKSEFRQCLDLKDVFSLLSKCSKITPNIALGAIERIYELEKDISPTIAESTTIHVSVAKGAILDKLLKVVMKTEETQTILNILKTDSIFMEPYKYKFTNELLVRVVDNQLSIEQLCAFTSFLINNKNDVKYSNTIDKLWVGFIEREQDINEDNIAQLFNILPGLKVSKKIVQTLLEQKLSDLWKKIKVPAMQDILNTFNQEKYFSVDSYSVIGRWLNTNIHAIDEDSLLDIITKLTRLNYTDDQIEKAVEKYMKLKSSRINTYILMVGVLHYCMVFQIRNEHILNACGEYFIAYNKDIPASFLKSFIYPFGYLYFDPVKNLKFWSVTEQVLCDKFSRLNANDLCSIVLSFVYVNNYPLKLVSKMFSPEYLSQIDERDTLKQLHLVDTALSLECQQYPGPLLPKDQWSQPIPQDNRLKNIIEKIKNSFINIVGSVDKLSTNMLIPNLCSDETYLIDVMIHPEGMGNRIFNWKALTVKNGKTAILIHLPDHYCSDNEQLIGPQVMRKKHLRLLGFKVVSLKYSTLSQLYISHDSEALRRYLAHRIENAEPTL